MRVSKAYMLPGLSGVTTSIHTVPREDIASNGCLSHSDKNEIGISLAYCNGTHRCGADLKVSDGEPILSGIYSFPQPPSGGTEVALIGTASHPTSSNRPATPIGTDVTPLISSQ